MIEYNVYPGETRRIVTFSYDDGSENDPRLVALMNQYGVKGSFHLNGWRYIGMTPEQRAELREVYRGHEISCHTVHHGRPSQMPTPTLVTEVMSDRRILEKIAEYPVTGMSYPYGDYTADTVAAMRACGIVYSRTTVDQPNFSLPDDFMQWHPTCHHRNALPNIERFFANFTSPWGHPLLNIWGHSHELRTEEDWAYMESVIAKVANNSNIWYATYMDIYNYVTAQRSLVISVDEDVFYNPTATDVWVIKDRKTVIRIPAGQTVRLGD